MTIPGLQRTAWVFAFVGLLLSAVAFAHNGEAALFRSYLMMYIFVFGISIGCVGIGLLHSLTGGAWGDFSRPIVLAASEMIPWFALLVLPIVLGAHHIFPWTDPAVVNQDPHQKTYFDPVFFVGRAVLYFLLWSWMALRVRRPSGFNGFALMLYVFSVSFASYDWIMSLEALWSSAIFGLMVTTGFWLSAFAFIIVMQGWRARRGVQPMLPVQPTHDLGNLMLSFVMLWTYTMLSQHLIMWNGNLPDEIRWYLIRNRGGWHAFTILLLVSGFLIPFVLLLSRKLKQQLRTLVPVAGWVLATTFLSAFWLTVPEFTPSHFAVSLSDLAMVLFLGGVTMAFFCAHLKRAEAVA